MLELTNTACEDRFWFEPKPLVEVEVQPQILPQSEEIRRRIGLRLGIGGGAGLVGAAVVAVLALGGLGTDAGAASARVRAGALAKRASATGGPVRVYRRVGAEYGLQWWMLAGVGETDGPAQFLAATLARYGVDAGTRGRLDPDDPLDAVTAMAAYLKASGAPQNWPQALYTYNHSWAYVDSVLTDADRIHAGAARG